MAHTIDHKEEAVRIQESIAARDNKKLETGGPPKPSYAERMGTSMVNAWAGAKRIDNKWDPFEYAASAAAHSIEFMIPQTQEELLFELATLGQGAKLKLGNKLVRKAISKGVEPAFQKGKQVIGDLLNPKQMQLAEAGVGNVKSSNVLQIKGSGSNAVAKSFNQGADGVYNISKSQKGSLKQKLVAEVAANKGSKRGIKHRAIVAGELDEEGKQVLRFLRWNGPKKADRSLLKHWSFSKVSAQAKAAVNRAIGELGPLSHKSFRPWAKKLGYTDKQINAYAEYVEKSVKAYEKEMLDVNKILRKKGTPREELTTLAHNVAIEPHGIHGTRNIDFEQLSKNVSEGKHSAKPRSSQIATGVPHYGDKLKNWKADFIYYFDHKIRGGSGILPQKHEIARHIELMIERAGAEGGSEAVDDLLELLDL